ncbi:MAG: hypothetical protein IID44_26890 [Planctomycetes bacterium]|nr:hypothetical protein [Planctomycetota bacterium]
MGGFLLRADSPFHVCQTANLFFWFLARICGQTEAGLDAKKYGFLFSVGFFDLADQSQGRLPFANPEDIEVELFTQVNGRGVEVCFRHGRPQNKLVSGTFGGHESAPLENLRHRNQGTNGLGKEDDDVMDYRSRNLSVES